MEVEALNVNHALEEMIWKIKIFGKDEPSRNGPVLAMQEPTIITILQPTQRVLFDPVRNANPFFHVAEFVWMMSGSNDVRFVERFNKRMREYADPGTDIHHGAYGYRWRTHFGVDQIRSVIGKLRSDKSDRRAVIGMWDPRVDLVPHNDLPCNTQIYLRVVAGALDFTVCNRSNDLVWGCLGANAVHMTYLQELIAHGVGVPIGKYRVMTNNLHVYRGRPDVEVLLQKAMFHDEYGFGGVKPFPLLQPSESVDDLLMDCETIVEGKKGIMTMWAAHVALPVMNSFSGENDIADIQATDWRVACKEWQDRAKSRVLLKLQGALSPDSSSPGSSKSP